MSLLLYAFLALPLLPFSLIILSALLSSHTIAPRRVVQNANRHLRPH